MTTADEEAKWHPTAAFYRAIGFTVLCLGIGIVLGRPDVAVLGIPMALGLVMALSVRQPVRAQCPVPIAGTLGDVHGDRPVTVVTDVADLLGAQFVSLCTPDADGDPGGGTVTIPGGVDTSVEVRTKAVPWGTMVLARPDLLAVSSDALLTAGPFIGPELQVRVPPMVEKVGAFELPPIMGGWAGEHRSRRPGQGGDLIDLREFAPGDRLRSIHWRAYARHQKLFVRRTQSDADTDFVLCLDTRHEIVPKTRGPLTDWQRYRATLDRSLRDLRRFLMGLFRVAQPTDGRDSSLPRSSVDLTVAAATAVAAAQVKNGDRVGVLDLSNVRRHVRMGSGSRHLHRMRYLLAQTKPSRSRWMPKPELWGLPSSAVVVLFSPFIDDVAMQAAMDAGGRGHQVLVIDVLPVADLRTAARRDPHPQAGTEIRLLLAEREIRLDRLRARGIPVLAFDGGQIATDLTALMKARRHRR